MVDLKKLIAKQRQVADELLAEAKAYYDETGPVEVETIFGDIPATVLMPFMPPKDFADLSERFPPRPGSAVDAPVWFNLHAVARAYPGVAVRVDDAEDDLLRIDGDEIRYIWPDIFDAMPPEDQQNFHIAVWSMHVWEPKQRRESIKQRQVDEEFNKAADDAPFSEFVDAVVAAHKEEEALNG